MTVDHPHNTNRSRRNSRARRNSVVERIALSIPVYADTHHQAAVDDTLANHRLSLKRTPSSHHLPPVLIEPSHHILDDDQCKQSSLFPFSGKEVKDINGSFLDSFKYQILPSLSSLDVKSDKDKDNLKYQTFLDSCRFRSNQYEDLLGQSSQIIDDLTKLTLKYDTVTQDTSNFQKEADELITQYNKYTALNDQLSTTLSYYEQLDPIVRKLNNPSPNIVRKESFRKLLVSLDQCMSFLNSNTQHKEHEVYLRRFKQCQVRALTLIRNYVVGNLKNVSAEINSKMSTAPKSKLNSVTRDALIYTRFETDLQYLTPISAELCSRVHESEEYENLLNDCLHAYFNIRASYLQPLIREHFQANDTSISTIQFTQNNISFFDKLFREEFALYFQLFSTESSSLSLTNWFIQLAEPLYDTLRHRILREPSISNLCDLITLLEKHYEYDEEELEEDLQVDNNNNNDNNNDDDNRSPNYDQDFKIGVVLEPVLQDAQTRLVFRVQSFVSDQITNYRPSLSNFQISRRKNIPLETPETDEGERDRELIPTYPPLSSTLKLLTKTYQLLNPSIFDDLTHNIIHELIQSLLRSLPFAEKGLGSSLEGCLFLMRELLTLNSELSRFDLGFAENDTVLDFSGITKFMKGLLYGDVDDNDGKRSNGTNSSIFQKLGDSVPKVTTNIYDARIELQTTLNSIVEKFSLDAINTVLTPLQSSVEDFESTMAEFRANINSQYDHLHHRIKLYVSSSLDPDHAITTSLLESLQPLILIKYQTYYQQAIARDKSAVELLMEEDALAGYIEGVVLRLVRKDEEVEEEGQEESLY